MKTVNIIIYAVILIISGCSSQAIKTDKPLPISHYFKTQQNIKIEPIKRDIDILNFERVTFHARKIGYKNAISQILGAKSIGVAFSGALDKYVDKQTTVNLSLIDVTLREALNTITGIVGVSWQRRDNLIWITPFKTKLYDIGFLGVVRSSSATLGGDVLGGGSSDSASSVPLTGSFTLSSKSNGDKGDIYKILKANIKKLISKNGKFAIDVAGGILMVKDRSGNIRDVTKYINAISNSYNRQVMIEAKIIEVQLNKSSKIGINWTLLRRGISLKQQTINFGNGAPAMTLNISKSGGQFTSVIEALSNFGSLSLLSEPHLRVINAQPAILSVGKSISFIKKIELSTTTGTGGTSIITPTVDISSIFDGLVFGITPFIKNNNTVLLRIVPIKSKLVSLDEKTISGNTYTLPTVDLREESTVVSVKNGSIVMLGGLISKTSKNSSSGIPLLSNIPIAGLAFKQKEKLSNSVELVILIKPVIIN